jgi:GntR family transcriptional regulator, histidine utilization repressor
MHAEPVPFGGDEAGGPRVNASYQRIKADILEKIVRGDWKPGSAIPSEAELAEAYGSARTTVNRAMRELAEHGVIERKRKTGSRVRLSPHRQARFDIPIVRREIEDQGLAYRYALVSAAEIEAPVWLRARLGLPETSRALHLECMHFAGGTPYQHEDRWINLALLPQAREVDFTTIGPNEWLVQQIPFTDAEISISAQAAEAPVAAHLSCRTGDSLLQIERSTRWEGAPVTFVRLMFRRGHMMTTRY